MSVTAGSGVAADGSDIIAVKYIETDGTPDGASQTFNVRGYPIDLVAAQINAKTANIQVGYLSGNH